MFRSRWLPWLRTPPRGPRKSCHRASRHSIRHLVFLAHPTEGGPVMSAPALQYHLPGSHLAGFGRPSIWAPPRPLHAGVRPGNALDRQTHTPLLTFWGRRCSQPNAMWGHLMVQSSQLFLSHLRQLCSVLLCSADRLPFTLSCPTMFERARPSHSIAPLTR
jgi:hypothetical protein